VSTLDDVVAAAGRLIAQYDFDQPAWAPPEVNDLRDALASAGEPPPDESADVQAGDRSVDG